MVTLFNTIHETQYKFKKQYHTERTVVVNRKFHETSGGYSLAQIQYKLLQKDGLKSLSLRSITHSNRPAHQWWKRGALHLLSHRS